MIRRETTPTEADVLYMVKGNMPAINTEHYVRAQRPKRIIRAKNFDGLVKSDIVEKSVCNNSQCFVPIPAQTDPFKNPFFVRTIYDWNKLSESDVNCYSMEPFRTILTKRD